MSIKYLTNIDLNKNELQNAKVQNLAIPPSTPAAGQIYFSTADNQLYVYNGSSWVGLQDGDITAVTAGSNLTGGGTSGSVTLALATTITGLTSVSSTGFTGALTGNASTATTLQTARTIGGVSFNGSANINLPGVNTAGNQDTSGNAATATVLATARTINGVSFNGSANITVTAAAGTLTGDTLNSGVTTSSLTSVGTLSSLTVSGTVTIDSVGITAIQTSAESFVDNDTSLMTSAAINDLIITSTGVTSVSGTTGEVTVSASTGAVTIGLPDDVVIAGNLTVNGDTVTVNTATLTVEDPLIKLASGNTAADSVDIGLYGTYDVGGTDKYAGLFRDANDGGKFKLFKDLEAEPTTTVNTGGTGYTAGTLVVGTLEGNVTGALTGNASTATTLQTARSINGVSFNGSADITVTAAAGTLTGTTLNATVVSSSLTTVGTIGTGVWQGTAVAVAYGGTGATTASSARTNIGATASGLAGTTVARIAAVDCAADSAGTSTTTVTHNFGTKDVIVQVYDTTSGESVFGDAVRTNTNVVTVTLLGTISAGAYRIVVTAA